MTIGPGPKVPLGRLLEGLVRRFTGAMAGPLRTFSSGCEGLLENLVQGLCHMPPPWLIAVGTGLSAWARRRWRYSVAVAMTGLLVWNLGYWEATVETLVLTGVSVSMAVMVGIPLGIAAAHRPGLYRVLALLLDLMQTVPTFVYLIPVLMLFGLGVVPGVVATVIFALPAPIRLAYLGLRQVPRPMVEAAEAFGANPWQVLLTVELPHAKPALLEGISQALMLSLSMVVIAALVGAGGLGRNVVRALNNVDLGQGFEAALIIILLAVLLDRIFKANAKVSPAEVHGP